MFDFDYGGMRWGYCFLQTDSSLSEEARFELLTGAVELYLSGERQRDVRGDEFEGMVEWAEANCVSASEDEKKGKEITDINTMKEIDIG